MFLISCQSTEGQAVIKGGSARTKPDLSAQLRSVGVKVWTGKETGKVFFLSVTEVNSARKIFRGDKMGGD